MSKELIFALISVGLMCIGFIPLWRDIIARRTTPHPFTVWVWAILTLINIYILLKNGEYIGMIPPVCMGICLLWESLVWIFRIKHLMINWFDILCLSLSCICIIYLLVFKNLLNTVILTAIVDFIAILPTFKKWWLQPWTETIFNFFIWAISQLFIILALEAPNLETSIFWGYVFFIDIILVVLIMYRRYYLKWWKSIFE